MPNDKQRISHCRSCGRPRREGELFSARGKCAECGDGNAVANRRQLREHAGPFFEHWRRRCAAAFGAILWDDLADDSDEVDSEP